MRIGIFGGSFNPVHYGHLKLAERAVEELNLDRVIFVPSYQTPLKTETLLPASLRVDLLKIALKKYPRFSISFCELRRQGLSFTVDTLKFFRKKFGKKTTLYFLTGADALASLSRWKSLDAVLTLSRFIVMTRPGFSLGQKKPPRGVSFLALDALPISSSDIRKRLSRGKAVSHWMPRESAALLSAFVSATPPQSWRIRPPAENRGGSLPGRQAGASGGKKGGDSSKQVY